MERSTVCLLMVVNLMYVCIGAAIFMTLESENETTTSSEILSTVNTFLANHSTCLSNKELQKFLRKVLTAYQNGVFTTNETRSATQWDYPSSWFFAMTVTTTIGYGNQSPVTDGGRTFCIFYALLGIPLTGIMLLGLGEKLKFIVYSIQNRKCTKYEKTESFIKHIVLNVFIVGLLTLLPALVFHLIEDWTYGESVYYCFITLFTIGFGDFVVASNAEQNYKTLYKILVNIWIYIGLAWFTTIISYISDKYTESITEREDKYKISNDLPIAEKSQKTSIKQAGM
ncbi:potassium channel subfamily K member 2-like [Mytilus californianus]|uniref:potassium channel subfamily K member 2-like n=1 Tax=Mytilus californianus TaxID=6549 RepID=UPI002248655C|nr:potassium channel subfamily K member 2-like [Mytilus californianus]